MDNYKCLPFDFITIDKEKKYVLYPVRLKDIEKIRTWRNSQKSVLRQNKDISDIYQAYYFANYVFVEKGEDHPQQILLVMKEMDASYIDNTIAYGGLVNINYDNKSAEVSFLMHNDFEYDHKYYEERFSAFLAMIKVVGFEWLKLNSLFTETFQFRIEHIRVLENNEFHYRGALPQHVFKNNQYYDSIFHSIIKEQYKCNH